VSEAARPILPVDTDVDTEGFFEASRRSKLAICVCGSCGAVLHMPRAYCHVCGSWHPQWKEVAGRAELYSWTVVEHQVHPAYPVPYTIVLVDLTDAPGTRLVGCLPGRPHLEAGQRMRASFVEIAPNVVLPQWEPA
jgi:uncharacterized OB-fold protein